MSKSKLQLFVVASALTATCLSVYAFTDAPEASQRQRTKIVKPASIQGEGSYSDGTTQRNFSIRASVRQDGTVSGEVKYTQNETERNITVECLQFDDNIIYVSGKDKEAKPVSFVLYDSWERKRADLISSPIEGVGCNGDINAAAFSLNKVSTGKINVLEP